MVVLGTQDDDGRQKWVIERFELRNHLVATEVRHVDVEQDEVWACFPVSVEHLAWVFYQYQLTGALTDQQLAQQLEVGFLVINDENSS